MRALIFLHLCFICISYPLILFHTKYNVLSGESLPFKQPSIIHLPIRDNSALKSSKGFGRVNNQDEDISKSLSKNLKGTCLYFVGMMGSGKSTIGKSLAERIGYRFLDTDEIAEFMIEKPIHEFFNEGKEPEFRAVENQVLLELAQYTRVVVATGGGIVMKNENWGLLRHGIVVFLDVEPKTIYNRLSMNPEQMKQRPLLHGENPLQNLESIYSDRIEKYLQADVTIQIPSTYSTEASVALVLKSISDFIANNPPQWQKWKNERDEKAMGMAEKSNPEAMSSMGVNSIINRTPLPNTEGVGSVQYVKLSDIQSGKVKIPINPVD